MNVFLSLDCLNCNNIIFNIYSPYFLLIYHILIQLKNICYYICNILVSQKIITVKITIKKVCDRDESLMSQHSLLNDTFVSNTILSKLY
jgi:hypothetical protein